MTVIIDNENSPYENLVSIARNPLIYGTGFRVATNLFQRQLMVESLERCNMNESESARDLKMSRQLFNYHVNRLKIKIDKQRKLEFVQKKNVTSIDTEGVSRKWQKA